MAETNKVVVNLATGLEDGERVTVAFLVAGAALEKGKQVSMFLTKEAVRVALRDNGPGFTPEARTRLFEPFFTTKTQGTGLGMAIAKRIIATHGGDIAIGANSIPGAEIQVTVLKEGP